MDFVRNLDIHEQADCKEIDDISLCSMNTLVTGYHYIDAYSETVTDMVHALMTAFPCGKPDNCIFQCENGNYTVTMTANPHFGLPYGALPRLLLALITHEIKHTKSPVLRIGRIFLKLQSFFTFSDRIDKDNTKTYLLDQMLKLFSTQITLRYQENHKNQLTDDLSVCKTLDFWWNPLKGKKENITSSSTIVITNRLFDLLINDQVLIDLPSLHALQVAFLQSHQPYVTSTLKQGEI